MRPRACALLADAAGVRGMAGGQAIDLGSVGATLALPELESMHRMKTGALIRAAVRLGAACGRPLAGAEAAALDAYAGAAGLAFQVVDDVLDVEGSAASLGKTAGKDAAQGKPTFVSCSGSPAAKRARGGAARRSPRGARAVRRRRAPARGARRLDRAADALMHPLLDSDRQSRGAAPRWTARRCRSSRASCARSC